MKINKTFVKQSEIDVNNNVKQVFDDLLAQPINLLSLFDFSDSKQREKQSELFGERKNYR